MAGVELADANVDRLEAKRSRAAADVEQDMAKTPSHAGATVDLADFEAAAATARAELADAEGRVAALEPEAKVVGAETEAAATPTE